MIVCDTSVCLSVVFVQNSTTVLLHSLHSHSRQHETRGAQQHDVSTHHWQTELSPREDHQRRPLAHQQRLHRHVHNPRQHVRLRLTRSSRRYHDEHGELVPVERLEQERDVEGGAHPVHRICHIQYDQRDEQHQQHVARVALRLTPLPRRALVVDAVVDEHSRSPHQEGTEGLEQVADHRVGVLHVSATPHAHQRHAHRAEVEHQQHHHGENVQDEDRHAVLATAHLLRQHLPQIQAVDEVLVQTASLLSGQHGGDGQRDEGGREVCVESEDGDAIARGEGELAVRTERGADVSVRAASHADVSVLLTVLEKVRDQRVGGDVADAPLLHVHHAHRVALCITLSVIAHAAHHRHERVVQHRRPWLAHIGDRRAGDRHALQRARRQRLAAVQRRQRGSGHGTARRGCVNLSDGLALRHEVQLVVLGAVRGGGERALAARAVGEGEGGRDADEFVVGADRHVPTHRDAFSVHRDGLDLVGGVLVALGMSVARGHVPRSPTGSLCRGGGG